MLQPAKCMAAAEAQHSLSRDMCAHLGVAAHDRLYDPAVLVPKDGPHIDALQAAPCVS